MKKQMQIKMRTKPISLTYLFFIAILIVLISFSSGCAEEGETSPEPAETQANSGAVFAENLTNIEWQWIGFQRSSSPENNTVVPDPENYTLSFFPDNTYYIKADCNGGSGNYILEGDSLTLNPPVMTLIACGPESLDSEYLSLLSDVSSATLENEHLILYSENTGQRMFFTAGGGLSRTFNLKLNLPFLHMRNYKLTLYCLKRFPVKFPGLVIDAKLIRLFI